MYDEIGEKLEQNGFRRWNTNEFCRVNGEFVDWNTTLNSMNETPAPVSPVNTVWGMPPFRCWIDTSQCMPVTNRAWETFCFLRPSIAYFSDIDFWKPLCAQKITQSRNLSIRRLVLLAFRILYFCLLKETLLAKLTSSMDKSLICNSLENNI